MLAKKSDLSIARELDVSDLHVEVIDLMNNRVEGEIGLGVFIAAFSALKKAPPSPPCWSWETQTCRGRTKKRPCDQECSLPHRPS